MSGLSAGRPLAAKIGLHGPAVQRVGAQAVHRFRRKSHQAAGDDDPGGLVDDRGIGPRRIRFQHACRPRRGRPLLVGQNDAVMSRVVLLHRDIPPAAVPGQEGRRRRSLAGANLQRQQPARAQSLGRP